MIMGQMMNGMMWGMWLIWFFIVVTLVLAAAALIKWLTIPSKDRNDETV